MTSRELERPIVQRRGLDDARMTIWSAFYYAGCVNGLGTMSSTGWFICPLKAAAAALESACGGCICSACRPLVEHIEDTPPLRLVGVDQGR